MSTSFIAEPERVMDKWGPPKKTAIWKRASLFNFQKYLFFKIFKYLHLKGNLYFYSKLANFCANKMKKLLTLKFKLIELLIANGQ